MAIKCLRREGGEGENCIAEYLCDTEEDVANLPTDECGAGSTTIVATTKAILIMNTQGAWV